MKRPIEYLEETKLEKTCGALLTPLALDALNRAMVEFARDYARLYDGTPLEEFEKKTFGYTLLPPQNENL